MNIKKHFVEVKIGVFFIVGFIILFITLLSIRQVNYIKGTYILKVRFSFAEGMRAASPVRFCGVDVGEVKAVQVRDDGVGQPYVLVYLKIQNDIKIPRDSYFFINSLSLFGEKYLEISPASQITGYLKPNDIVEGISPVPLFNIFITFNRTMKEVSDFVKEGKVKTSFQNILNNMEEATGDFKSLIKAVKDQEGTVGKLFYDKSLYTKTEEFIEDIKNNPWKLLHKPKEKPVKK